jgi:hypothetical protein
MSLMQRKRGTDYLIASLAITAGLALTTFSLRQIANVDRQLAQTTPPLQASPPVTPNDRPAESKPGGTRPTTPAPEPARPNEQAQKEGAKAALPSAPPEKVAPPLQPKSRLED